MKKILAFIMITAISAGSSFAAVKAGTVAKAKGSVDVVKVNAVIGKIARQGTDLALDDILRTKRNAYAEVKFIDGSQIKMFEKSRLVLNGIQRSKDGYNAEVQKGKVLFKVEKMYDVAGDFRIKTSNAVIGVKGTSVAVDVRNSGTLVELYTGAVRLDGIIPIGPQGNIPTPPPPVILAPGQGAFISPTGTVATYSFGTPGAPSALFPGATGDNSQPQGATGDNSQSQGVTGGSPEDQLFNSLGSGEAAHAGEGSGSQGGSSSDDLPQSGSFDRGGSASDIIQSGQSPANDIYNSANRPSTPQQVEQSLGTVNIHINFE